MNKLYVFLFVIGIIALGSCKKEQNCKCQTGTVTTDFYKKLSKDDARSWCDTLEIQMNNGNNPQKDSTYCTLHLHD